MSHAPKGAMTQYIEGRNPLTNHVANWLRKRPEIECEDKKLREQKRQCTLPYDMTGVKPKQMPIEKGSYEVEQKKRARECEDLSSLPAE